jgi:group I intron endonuclease
MEPFGVIYKATNTVNGKIYIGQTVRRLSYRRKIHIRNAFVDKSNTYFHRSIRKHGRENFVWEIIEYCNSADEMNDMEFHYIKQYNSFKPGGYNMTYGGDGTSGYNVSEETKKKIGKKAKDRLKNPKNNPMYGKELTVEHRSNISKALKGRYVGKDNPWYGRKHSEESKLKMSKSRSGSNNHFYGEHLSKEHRRKISESNKGREFSEEHRRNISKGKKGKYVGAANKTSKRYVITFPNGSTEIIHGLSEFCRQNGLCQGHMSSCATHKRKSHKGFKCELYTGD